MKHSFSILAAVFAVFVVMLFVFTVYGAEPKRVQTSVWQGTEIKSDKNEISEIPCFASDLDTDFFACVGVHQGRKNQNKEEVKAFALAEAVNFCSMKLGYSMKGISGRSLVDPNSVQKNFFAVSGTAQVSCVKYSIKDGIVTAYVGIKVSKKESLEKLKELDKMVK